jgi:alkylation response protein AidB-like acyl-CoA dehydrogenase
MNLDLSETQQLVQQTVRGYLESELPLDRVRELERSQGWDDTLWQAVCENGWLALPFDSKLGGEDGSRVDLGLLVEAFARRAAIVPIMEVAVAGLSLQSATRVAQDLIPDVLAGKALPVPALADAPVTIDDAGRLSGIARFVDYGQFASHHVVVVPTRSQDGPTGLWLVDVAATRDRFESLHTIGRTPVCPARYDRVAATQVGDAEAADDLVRLARALTAVQCVGAMQQALDMTIEYAKVREQFGKAIGSFQAVRHHCANMASRVASARGLAYEVLSALDAGSATDSEIAAAKASASRAAPDVLMLAHQIFGGNGVIEENDLYFFTLRGKERSLAWGSVDECLGVMAGALEDPVDWL